MPTSVRALVALLRRGDEPTGNTPGPSSGADVRVQRHDDTGGLDPHAPSAS